MFEGIKGTSLLIYYLGHRSCCIIKRTSLLMYYLRQNNVKYGIIDWIRSIIKWSLPVSDADMIIPTFMEVMTWRIFLLLKDKETKHSAGLAQHWLSKEAAALVVINKAGTFRFVQLLFTHHSSRISCVCPCNG